MKLKLREGSLVYVYARGSRTSRLAVVVQVEDDVKNGEPGIDYYWHGASPDIQFWCYWDQIGGLVKY